MALTRRPATGGPGRAGWDAIEQMIHLRSGGRCEARTPDCLAGPGGDLNGLPRHRRSLHHRRPRGKGGTSRTDVHSLAALVDVCGDGVAGCHGYIERHRTWATSRGLLVPNLGTAERTDPARVALTLPSGRRVLLDPEAPFYLPVADGRPYDLSAWPTTDDTLTR